MLHDVDIESALAGLGDPAFHRDVVPIGIRQHLHSADARQGLGKPYLAFIDGNDKQLEPVPETVGELSLVIQQFLFVHNAVDLCSGVEKDGLRADGDNLPADFISHLQLSDDPGTVGFV